MIDETHEITFSDELRRWVTDLPIAVKEKDMKDIALFLDSWYFR